MTSWGGPGSPLLVIVGGEGAIPPSTGLFYPFVVDTLAPKFHGAVLEPEHRFYGESLPFGEDSMSVHNLHLLTPQQAMADLAYFITEKRKELGCGSYGTPSYCPVMTIGGSYPGYLSSMMRLRYPAVVDMAYAASSPHYIYAQQVDQYAYYKVITDSAEKASAGCANAVRQSLSAMVQLSKRDAMKALNVCPKLPDYLDKFDTIGDKNLFFNEVNMVVMYTFATLNMGNYPPPNTQLRASCQAIQNAKTPLEGLAAFLQSFAQDGTTSPCFDMVAQLPAGKKATISSGDWTGVGTGVNGESWDVETCGFLIEQIGTNNVTDMFLPMPFTLDWLNTHCSERFNTVPQPTALNEAWGFDRLTTVGASHIVFTNGLNDGWSVGGVKEDLSDTIIAINIGDGAHHSDLSAKLDDSVITKDVINARAKVISIFDKWLAPFRVLPPVSNGAASLLKDCRWQGHCLGDACKSDKDCDPAFYCNTDINRCDGNPEGYIY
jgi:hypothetical protein